LPTLSLQDPNDEEKLVQLLRSYRAHTGKAITVVFDPGQTFHLTGVHQIGGLEVVFAPHSSSADAAIVRRVRSSRNRRGWLVVTSDQELADTVARLGARVQSAQAFAGELGSHESKAPDWRDTPPSPDEVEAWLALFEGRTGQQTGE
jgi:predicted RNA-binding protein with PIN domain